jgi:hypothetical protein
MSYLQQPWRKHVSWLKKKTTSEPYMHPSNTLQESAIGFNIQRRFQSLEELFCSNEYCEITIVSWKEWLEMAKGNSKRNKFIIEKSVRYGQVKYRCYLLDIEDGTWFRLLYEQGNGVHWNAVIGVS